mmetsp:Transcript_17424/g.35986  ORF Transcript_17424/g.35986 Transcript_17424/m.35986 type:complete len:206 (+) Transcript_17424:3381-3998(+)
MTVAHTGIAKSNDEGHMGTECCHLLLNLRRDLCLGGEASVLKESNGFGDCVQILFDLLLASFGVELQEFTLGPVLVGIQPLLSRYPQVIKGLKCLLNLRELVVVGYFLVKKTLPGVVKLSLGISILDLLRDTLSMLRNLLHLSETVVRTKGLDLLLQHTKLLNELLLFTEHVLKILILGLRNDIFGFLTLLHNLRRPCDIVPLGI